MPTVTDLIGPAGRLDAILDEPFGSHARSGQAPAIRAAVVFAHPHPQYGGTMHTKAVFQGAKGLVRIGCAVLRFNFRGVGRSQASYDNGIGELSDAAYAFDWAQSVNPSSPYCWIGGYSFGALIAMQLMMRRPEIEGFLSISPPAGTEDFSFLAPCPSSGLIVHGDSDEHVPVEAVQKLSQKLKSQKNITIDFKVIKGADHFYQNKMEELKKAIEAYVDHAMKEQAKAAKPA